MDSGGVQDGVVKKPMPAYARRGNDRRSISWAVAPIGDPKNGATASMHQQLNLARYMQLAAIPGPDIFFMAPSNRHDDTSPSQRSAMPG